MQGFNAIGMDATGTSGAASSQAGAGAVALTGSGCAQTNGTSAGAVTVNSAPNTVNLTGTTSTQVAQSGAGAATVNSGSGPQGTVTVPSSRTAVFAARSRVAVFSGTAPVSMTKGAQDQLYVVADVTRDLSDGATTIASGQAAVSLIPTGVAVLEGPSVQGGLIVVKLGSLDTSNRAVNSVTFRVTCANGEVFDRTLVLTAFDDRSQVFGKDPDDRRYFAFDISADLALSNNTTIATVQAPVAVGVSALSTPAIQGGLVVLLLGGLDLSSNAVNSCALTMLLATGEVINRTIYFSRQDH